MQNKCDKFTMDALNPAALLHSNNKPNKYTVL